MPLHVIVKGKDIIWEQMQGHNSQISYARQTKHVKDKQKQTESSFSQVSVSPLSKTWVRLTVLSFLESSGAFLSDFWYVS